MLKNRKTITRFRYGGIAVALALVAGAFLLPHKAQAAASNPAGSLISVSNDFYAYVETGENLDASFVKDLNGSGAGDVDAVITVSRPGASDTTCTVQDSDVVTTSCDFNNLTASSSGIWRLRFAHTLAIDRYSWSIEVENGSTDIPGRVWTSLYSVSQAGGSISNGIDFSMWYQSDVGYQYRADYTDYNGIESNISASSLGLVTGPGSCTPLYKSVNRLLSGYALAPASCDAAYKVFFEEPASDLPASAAKWDSTTDWIKPAIASPAINNLAFTPTTAHSRDGDISFDLDNYNGQLDVHIDANNNGSYNDPEDVTIPTAATSGAVTVAYDGKDGNGNTIPASQAIKFKIALERNAEIHFLMTDVEQRGGGIAVERLNGPSGGETNIYWDDTSLPISGDSRCSTTSQLDGTAGEDSTGGVHAWGLTGCGSPQFGNFNDTNSLLGSWGDGRIINDWAYAPTNASAVLAIEAFNDPEAPVLANTGQAPLVLAGMAIALVGLPTGIFIALKKYLLS